MNTYIMQGLHALPDELRRTALSLHNAYPIRSVITGSVSLPAAVAFGFSWSRSPQGNGFWRDIQIRYARLSRDPVQYGSLPPPIILPCTST